MTGERLDGLRERLDEIRRTHRHAEGTRSTETDSWLNGYQDDVRFLLGLVERQEAALKEAEEGILERGYSCAADGYSQSNRGNWCDLGCGTDYNRMIPVVVVRAACLSASRDTEGKK